MVFQLLNGINIPKAAKTKALVHVLPLFGNDIKALFSLKVYGEKKPPPYSSTHVNCCKFFFFSTSEYVTLNFINSTTAATVSAEFGSKCHPVSGGNGGIGPVEEIGIGIVVESKFSIRKLITCVCSTQCMNLVCGHQSDQRFIYQHALCILASYKNRYENIRI